MPKTQPGDLPAQDPVSLWTLFLNTRGRIMGHVESELDDCELPHVWFDVLHQLRQYGGKLRPTELAGLVMLSKSGLTRLVDRMAAAKLVTRDDCNDDGRGAYVSITKAGRAALTKALPRYRKALNAHFLNHLAPWEQRAFADILLKLNSPR